MKKGRKLQMKEKPPIGFRGDLLSLADSEPHCTPFVFDPLHQLY